MSFGLPVQRISSLSSLILSNPCSKDLFFTDDILILADDFIIDTKNNGVPQNKFQILKATSKVTSFRNGIIATAKTDRWPVSPPSILCLFHASPKQYSYFRTRHGLGSNRASAGLQAGLWIANGRPIEGSG